MQFDFAFIQEFTNNLGNLLGPKCEIVVHDFTRDLEHTIVHIVNGALSGRALNGCPTNLFFENYHKMVQEEVRFREYYTTTKDGRTIRSSTTFLKDDEGKIVGAICVNIDVTSFEMLRGELDRMIGSKGQIDSGVGNERFVKSVQELMDQYLDEVETEIGKPAAVMDKSEKKRALAFLDSKGIFQIAKAHRRLCEFFNISKFTLYNYLDEVRENSSGDLRWDEKQKK